jgi:subfamily B ATP-binding cassette protein MsbA
MSVAPKTHGRRSQKLSEEVVAVRSLIPLLRTRPGVLVALVVLGVLTSLAEGVGISLFIPFLQSLDGGRFGTESGRWFTEALEGLFRGVPPEHRLPFISVCILVSIVLKAGLSYGYEALFGWLDVRIGHRLRTGVFHQLLTVGYGFIEKSDYGDLLNTLATETWRTGDALRTMLYSVVLLCTTLIYVALLLLISWRLTLGVGVAMLGISWLVQRLSQHVKALGEEVTRANKGLATRMLEGLAGMKAIRTFVRETHEQERFDRASMQVSRIGYRLGLVSGAVGPIYEVLTAGLLVCVLLLGARSTGDLPALLVFIFVLYRLQPRIRALDGVRLSLISLAPAVREVTTLLSPEGKPYIRSGSRPFVELREGLRFEGVSFRYDPALDPALSYVDAFIPAGKVTAIVGPSGAGKSTFIKLLFRFYDPSEGAITIDGVPLGDLDLTSWRERIALVSQDSHVFNATVRENILYGRFDATDAEVVAAAKRADAHGFITALPDGYDTRVGERGTRLSGGQQQRLSLARAIVRDPALFILDEATNALDTLSEQAVQEALESFGRNRTVVVIAHRLSTIEQADHVIVLDEGRVVEQGAPGELLARGGLFAKLHRLQFRSILASES